MNKFKILFPALMYLVTGTFFMSCETQPPKSTERLIIRAYTSTLAKTELDYLTALDPKQLSKEDASEQKTREADLDKLLSILQGNDALYGGIIEALYGGHPPGPLPCPIVSGCSHFTGISIAQFELGVYSDLIQGATASIITDDKQVFAAGNLKTPFDTLFKTARFTFTIKDGKLAEKPMTLRIQTSTLNGKDLQNIQLAIPLPAGTFLGY